MNVWKACQWSYMFSKCPWQNQRTWHAYNNNTYTHVWNTPCRTTYSPTTANKHIGHMRVCVYMCMYILALLIKQGTIVPNYPFAANAFLNQCSGCNNTEERLQNPKSDRFNVRWPGPRKEEHQAYRHHHLVFGARGWRRVAGRPCRVTIFEL